MYPPSLLHTCSNCSTWAVTLMYLFLILPILVTLNENLNIFNSVRSSGSCFVLSANSLHDNFSSCLHLIHPHVFCPASTNFSSSFLQSIPAPVQALYHLLSTTDHSVICQHNCPLRLLLDLISQPVHHHRKQHGVQSWSLNPYVTPTIYLITVLLSSYMSCNTLTCFSATRLPRAVPQFLSCACHMLSLDQQRSNEAPSDLYTSPSTLWKYTSHLQCSSDCHFSSKPNFNYSFQ